MSEPRYALLLVLLSTNLISWWTTRASSIPDGDVLQPKTALGKHVKRRSVKITDASDFMGLVKNSDAFIDKTLLIKEIIEHREKVLLITRPRKWGKTININMLRLFFGFRLNKNGKIITPNGTKEYRLFRYGEYPVLKTRPRLQEPLLIAKYEALLDEHQSQYLVIHVSMKVDRGNDFDGLMKSIRAIISGTYRLFGFMTDILKSAARNQTLSKSQQKKYEKYSVWFNKMTTKDSMPLDKIQSAFHLLSKIMHDHFKKPVILLMDDYDAPLRFAIGNNTVPISHKMKFITFYQRFLFESFKLNTHLKKGVLTGELRQFKEDLFYEYKIAYKQTCVDDQFHEYYGISETEARWLFDHRNVSEEARQKARDLYLGYQPINSSTVYYNVHTFASFLDEKKYKSYWIESEVIEPYMSQFLKVPSFKETFTGLIYGNEVSILRQDLHFNATDFVTLQDFVNDYNKVPANFKDLVLSYLFSTGYLTTDRVEDQNVYLRFPNKEISNEMRIYLSRQYRFKFGVAEPQKAKPLIEDFKIFVNNNFNNTLELSSSLTRFLSPKSPRQVDQQLLRQVLNYLAIYIDTFNKFSVVSDDMPDLVLLGKRTAIIFKCTVNAPNAHIALKEAKIYEDLLQDLRTVETIGYVGVNLNPQKQIQIKVETQPHRHYVSDT